MAYDVDTGGASGGSGGKLDLFTLMRVDTSQITALGFHDASKLVADAYERFDDVQRVVVNGVAWTGEGQPQAALVMRSNATALETAKVQMAAAMSALEGLATAIETAQEEVNAVVSTQTGQDIDLRDYLDGAGASIEIQTNAGPAEFYRDGRVFLTTHEEPAPVPGNQAKMASILIYARSADLAASQLLHRINAARPVFSASATGKTLAFNAVLLSVADTHQLLADTAKNVWTRLGPYDWEPLPETNRWSLWKSVTSSATDFVEGLPITQAGLLLRDIYNRDDRAARDRLEAYTIDRVTGLVDGKVKKTLPELKIVLGVPEAIESGRVIPETYTGPSGVDTPFDTPLTYDSNLQDLVDRYYTDDPGTNLTLEQLARLQRQGLLESDDTNYLQEARELRDDIHAWLDRPDTPSIGPIPDEAPTRRTPVDSELSNVGRIAYQVSDRVTAEQLAQDLDRLFPTKQENALPLLASVN